jgi:glycosyltransferase involved in cell wall biosynthesis
MIGIMHGYLLDGSGSNLWTRCVVESLCMQGIDVQLVCQEPHPRAFDCIAEAHRYDVDGTVTELFRRATPYPGKCIMHQPMLDEVLPVFVWDRYEQHPVVTPMVDLADDVLERYVERNVDVVLDIVRRYGVTSLHANHASLVARVAERVKEEKGIPYTVMPHGSELEYALKPDARFRRMAADALRNASRVFVHGAEMQARVQAAVAHEVLLPDAVFETLPLGVHTSQFEPVPRDRRREKIGRLLVSLHDKRRGRDPRQLPAMLDCVERSSTPAALRECFAGVRYDNKSPDADLEDKIGQVDWEHDAILLFVGRLISAKGVQMGLAALPLLLARDPGIRLIAVGHGPLREPMEALLWALQRGDRAMVDRIVDHGRMFEGSIESSGAAASQRLSHVRRFLDDLTARGEIDAYYELARTHLRPERVIFTGYLTHTELQHLFPCCDAGLFPSLVKEAGPLVFLEALASGCFPLGTYFGGMRASIDKISDLLPDYVADSMKLDPRDTVADIVYNVSTALQMGVRYKDVLVSAARARHDWTSVGQTLATTLNEIVIAERAESIGQPMVSVPVAAS